MPSAYGNLNLQTFESINLEDGSNAVYITSSDGQTTWGATYDENGNKIQGDYRLPQNLGDMPSAYGNLNLQTFESTNLEDGSNAVYITANDGQTTWGATYDEKGNKIQGDYRLPQNLGDMPSAYRNLALNQMENTEITSELNTLLAQSTPPN